MFKKLREQFIQYEKERLSFSRKVKSILFSSAFMGIVMSSFGTMKAMAAEPKNNDSVAEYTTDQVVSDSPIHIDDILSNDVVATPSNAIFSIGDEVYARDNARIWTDEYSLFDDHAGKKMKYPESIKKIDGCVFLINDCPKLVFTSEKAMDYQSKYETVGYLVNGVEGFLRACDVYQLEETLETVSQEDMEKKISSVDEVVARDVNAALSDVVATSSNAIASPSNVVATPSNVIASPSNVVATPSNVIATPSDVVATSSNVIATANHIATGSNAIATPSNASVPFSIYKINEQISVRPTAKFYNSVKKFNQSKGAKAYPYELGWNKVTGIVVNGKVYHEKNAEKLVEAINQGGVIEGYEINHVRYLKPESIYQKDQIQISDEELKEKAKNVYTSDTTLTILPGSRIYSNEDDLRNLKNGNSAYYEAGTEKNIFRYVLTDHEESFVVEDYDKVLEYLSIGYDFDGYLIINQYSKNFFGTIEKYEGFFKGSDIVTKEFYDQNIAKAATSVATPSNASVATPSNAVLENSSLNVATNVQRRMYLLQLREALRDAKQNESRNLAENAVSRRLTRTI